MSALLLFRQSDVIRITMEAFLKNRMYARVHYKVREERRVKAVPCVNSHMELLQCKGQTN